MNSMNMILHRYLEEIESLKAQLRVKEKALNSIIDYAKFYICPTCTNACSCCPIEEGVQVECVVCGEMVYRKDAVTDFNNDYICKKCEREGME